MQYKKCNKCGQEKEVTFFPVRKGSKDGYRNTCTECKSQADYSARLFRLSDPVKLEKERKRLRNIQLNKTPIQIQRELDRANIRHRQNRALKAKKFLEDNGITLQEKLRLEKENKFLSDSAIKHKEGHYSYHLMDFKNITTKIEIWCNIHRKSFWQLPKYHKMGQGCVDCGKISTGDNLRKTQEEFIKQAEEFCGGKYTFQDVIYVTYSEPVQVTCLTHGNFPISPANLLIGRGCPDCAVHGYRKSLPGHFYILKNEGITKIGITNRTPEIRTKGINKSKPGFEVVYSQYYEDGAIPLAIETSMLWWLPRCYDRMTEKFDGSTECFFGINAEEITKIAKDIGKLLEEQNVT